MKYALILKCSMPRKDSFSVLTFHPCFPLFFLFHAKLLKPNAWLPFWDAFYCLLTPSQNPVMFNTGHGFSLCAELSICFTSPCPLWCQTNF